MEFESIVSSPIGPLTLRATEKNLTALVLEHDGNRDRHLSAPAKLGQPGEEPTVLAQARAWLADYFAGKRPDLQDRKSVV